MIIFRPLRLTLDESMEEAAIFADKDLMFDHIVKINTYPGIGPMFAKEDIAIVEKSSFDRTLGWKDCRQILVSLFDGEECSKCVGYCATKFPREEMR